MKKLLSIVLFGMLLIPVFAFGQNQVLTLDGNGDYLDLPDGFSDFTNGITIECWAKPTSVKNWARFIDFGNGPGINNILFTRVASSNDISFDSFGGFPSVINVSNSISLNSWQHFAVSLDASGNVTILKNGFVVGTGTISLPTVINRVNNYIGRSNWSFDDYFEGEIDEVRVWNTGRTESEIQSSMNISLTGNEPNLIAYWNFDDGTATDLSPNNYDGTLMDNASITTGSLVLNTPTLEYSTFLGGNSVDEANGIDVNDNGEVYLIGRTLANDFPTTAGAWDNSLSNYDPFVTKFSSDGTTLIFSTFVGGSNSDEGAGIAVDDNGNSYLTGRTSSSDFPTLNAFDSSKASGTEDAFVTKLSPNGSALIYSTFLGGTNGEHAYDIAINQNGNVFVTGWTSSTDFPTQNAYDSNLNGSSDIFITKLSVTGASLEYSTYLGGNDTDRCYDFVLDSNENIILTGYTNSSDYPTQNAFDSSYDGSSDVIVSKLSSDGSSLIFSTYLGGSALDKAFGIILDNSENIILTGYTGSNNFPTLNAYDSTINGAEDAFLTKISSNGNLIYSTFLGGSSIDVAIGVALDEIGNVFLSGVTISTDFPTLNSGGTNFLGVIDLFIAQFNSTGSTLNYSTYLGGSSQDYLPEFEKSTIYKNENLYITGFVESTDFPTTNGAYDQVHGGFGEDDAILLRFDIPPVSGAIGSLSENSLDFGSVLTTDDLAIPVKIYSTGTVDLAVTSHSFSNGTTFSTNLTTPTISIGDSASFTITFQPTSAGTFSDTLTIFTNDIVYSSYSIVLSGTGSLPVNPPTFEYGSYFGGTSSDYIYGMSIHDNGEVYLTGNTYSGDFPTTSGVWDITHNANTNDIFVSKFSSDLTTLGYSTYIGGDNFDGGNAISVDCNGYTFLTGRTNSSDFPTTQGAYDSTFNGVDDLFLIKLTPEGSSLIFSTYLGGSAHDQGNEILVNSDGNAFITGRTYSSDFPTVNAYDSSHNGDGDVYVVKFSSDGTMLDFSTYFGGNDYEESYELRFDSNENILFNGKTESPDFPTQNAYDSTLDGSEDIFIAKLSSDGSTLLSSTYLGGSQGENSIAMTLDSSENIIIAGNSYSPDFPTVNAYDSSHNGSHDLIIAKLSSDGSTLLFSTYLGGSFVDFSYGISLDENENIYVTGITESPNFPTVNAFDAIYGGNDDMFVIRLNSTGSTLEYSTYLGGNGSDGQSGYGFSTIYKNGSLYVIGDGWSSDFPTTIGSYSQNVIGGTEIYLARFDTPDFSGTVGALSKCSLDFGSVATSSDSTVTVSISSTGTTNLSVSSHSFSNGTAFSTNLATPTIPSGNSSSFTITFDPQTVDVFMDTLTVFTNDMNTPSYTIELIGIGAGAPSQITDLEISNVGADVILTWTAKPNASLYKIYRSTSPEFTTYTQIGSSTPSGNPPTYSDVGASQSVVKYYYYVTWED